VQLHYMNLSALTILENNSIYTEILNSVEYQVNTVNILEDYFSRRNQHLTFSQARLSLPLYLTSSAPVWNYYKF
jgi:hypothetical protein